MRASRRALAILLCLALVGTLAAAQSPRSVTQENSVADPFMRLMQALDDELFRGSASSSLFPLWRTRTSDSMTPLATSFRVDVVEKDKAFVVKADMPGVGKDQVQIKMEGDNLVIEAQRKDEKVEKDETRHIQEVSYGKIYRSFRLPSYTDPAMIEATMDKGVLSILIPKTEAPKDKVIPIKVIE